jgi:hypothetical protein
MSTQSPAAAEPDRADSWIVTYHVEVLFDTDTARSRYDHVGTLARCSSCGQHLDLHGAPVVLAQHARSHEQHLSRKEVYPTS